MDFNTHKLQDTLKTAHYSMTKPRLDVFYSLTKHGPCSVGRLATLAQPSTDRATVYRTIRLFEQLGIVNRIWHGFKHQVELSEIFMPHHHHARCQACKKIIDITSPELEAALTMAVKRHQFLSVGHSIELTGYCQNCQ